MQCIVDTPLKSMDNITFYGIDLEDDHCDAVIEFVSVSMAKSFNGTPITYDDHMICMAGDLTLHVWGSPAETHAEVIELSPPWKRTYH